MERLTYRDENGKAWANIKNNYTAREAQEFGRIALEQLAAYEDSGLSPEEVHKLVKVLEQAIRVKMEFNKNRPYKHGKKF